MGLFGFGKKKELAKQEEIRKKAELEKQAELRKKAEFERQAELKKITEIVKQEEIRKIDDVASKSQRTEAVNGTVDEIHEFIKDSKGMALVAVRGMTIEEDMNLRKMLRDIKVSFKVYKSTYIRRAIKGTEFENLDRFCEGPHGYAFFKNLDDLYTILLYGKKINDHCTVTAACYEENLFVEHELINMLDNYMKDIDEKDGITAESEVISGIVETKTYSVVLKDCGANKMEMIKVVREIMGYGLKESKEFVEKVSPRHPGIVAEDINSEEADIIVNKLRKAGGVVEKNLCGENSPAPNNVEKMHKGLYNVVVTNHNGNKVQAIKVVYDITGQSLKDSKNLIDKLDSSSYVEILRDVEYERAAEALKRFEDCNVAAKVINENDETELSCNQNVKKQYDYYLSKILNRYK